METVSSLAARHVLSQLYQLQRSRPLFVGIQGPQGSGKTHLTKSLVSTLTSAPHSLRVAVFSVDDLYLTHSGLVDLAERHPGNMLWKGRGQPGTHDVKLGADILEQLRDLNTPPDGRTVTLPIFDKSKFNGEGDRLSEGVKVDAPIDIVILEGWCMGFYLLDKETLRKKWDSVLSESDGSFGNDLSIVRRAMKGVSRKDIEQANEALRGYVEHWYPHFQAFIQVSGHLARTIVDCTHITASNNNKIKPPEHSPFEYIYKVN